MLRHSSGKRVAGRVYHSGTMRFRDPKLFAALFALPLLLVAAACASSTHAPEYTPTGPAAPTSDASSLFGDGQPALRTIVADINGTAITLEVADDPDERTDGLSRRDSLADDAGMLFVWDEETSHTLWMKEMRFDLDFIWLDTEKRVVSIDADVPVQPDADDTDLVLYRPNGPVLYAIELEAGEAARLGVAVGDVIAFDEAKD